MNQGEAGVRPEEWVQVDRIVIALAAGAVLGLILLARGNTNKQGVTLPMHSPNDRSRWATVYSLAERGTYAIDITPWPPSIDRVRLDGHFYSSKPPLLPTLLAGEYLMLKKLSGGRFSFENSPETVIRTMVATVNWVPFVAFLTLFARFLRRLSLAPWVHAYALAAASCGTYLTGFAVTLNNHTIAAFSSFFAIYPVCLIVCDQRRDLWLYGVAGFFAAAMCVNEFPAAALAAPLFLALAWKDPGRTFGAFVPLALIPLAAHFYTNYLVTGNLLPAYLDKTAYVFEGSYWKIDPQTGKLIGSHTDPVTGETVIGDPNSIDSQHENGGVYLFHMILGHHGILSLSPIFLFSVIGVVRVLRENEPPLKPFAWLTAGLTLLMLFFYAFLGPRNYGGMTSGLRWLFWLIPSWLVFLPSGLERDRSRKWIQWAAVLFLAISTMSAFYATRNPWTRPWLHEALHSAELIRY